jgi:hypothetical protein
MLLLLVGGCLAVSAYADTATVNTPGDGFLALRSEPSTKQGVRPGKIPHGTLLDLGGCVRHSATQRWCIPSTRGFFAAMHAPRTPGRRCASSP